MITVIKFNVYNKKLPPEFLHITSSSIESENQNGRRSLRKEYLPEYPHAVQTPQGKRKKNDEESFLHTLQWNTLILQS